jgi:nitrogen regulatory protein PII 2
MVEVMAIIRMNMINKTKEQLLKKGFSSVTCRKVMGRGKKKVDYSIIEGYIASGDMSNALAESLSEGHRLVPKRLITLIIDDSKLEEVIETIKRVVLVLNGEMKRAEIQDMLGLKDRENFVLNYLVPSLESAFIEMTIPETPTHQEQRYRLTSKGIDLKKKLKNPKRKND